VAGRHVIWRSGRRSPPRWDATRTAAAKAGQRRLRLVTFLTPQLVPPAAAAVPAGRASL
jgi:hypothetical protein